MKVLRILRNDVDAHRVILLLEGHVAGEWVDLLERECVALTRSGLSLALDLSGVGFIGRAGYEALSRLSRAEVAIIGCTPLIADALEEEGIAASRKVSRADDERVR